MLLMILAKKSFQIRSNKRNKVLKDVKNQLLNIFFN